MLDWWLVRQGPTLIWCGGKADRGLTMAKKAKKAPAKKTPAKKKAPVKKTSVKKAPAKKAVKKPVKKPAKKRAKKSLSPLTKLEQALYTRMVELDEFVTDMGLAGAVEPAAKKPRKKKAKAKKR
jgi:hypothetical protein